MWLAIGRVRKTLPRDQFQSLVGWLQNDKKPTFQRVLLSPGSQTIRDISPFWLEPTGDLLREIDWAVAVLTPWVDQLRTFRQLANEIAKNIYSGRTDVALALLDSLDQSAGFTLWALEVKIALLQRSAGLEAQKQYVRPLKEAHVGTVAAYFAQWFSERNEDAVVIFGFLSKFDRVIEGSRLPQGIRAYLASRIAHRFPGDVASLCAVLAGEGGATFVDLYETGLAVVYHAWEEFGRDEKLQRAVKRYIRLGLEVRDYRAAHLSWLWWGGLNPDVPLKVRSTAVAEKLYTGHFETAAKLAGKEITGSAQDSFLFDEMARAVAYGASLPQLSSDYARTLCGALAAIYKKATGWQAGYFTLAKESMNFRGLPFLSDLFTFASLDRITGIEERVEFIRGILAVSAALEPADYGVSSPDVRELLRGPLTASYDSTMAWLYEQLQEDAESSTGGMDAVFVDMARALGAARRHEYSVAAEHAARLKKHPSTAIAREGSRILVWCYVKQRALKSAFDEIAAVCTEDEEVRFVFWLKFVFGNLAWRDLKECLGSISLPITLDLYLRDYDDDRKASDLAYSVKGLLAANNVQRPSDLAEKLAAVPRAQLVYFLRRIAIPSVLDMCLKASSSREVDEERVRICGLLVELDPGQKEQYELEVFEITKRFLIEDGLRKIDRSRVFVNADGLRRWAEREIKQGFDRYRALAQAGLTGSESSFAEAAKEFLKGRTPLPKEFLELPTGEGDSELIEMVLRLKDEFLTNPEHGLEFFLGTRIRHGSLAGHLRGPLDVRALIWSREEKSRNYVANDQSFRDILGLTAEQVRGLRAAFASFSGKYDSVIEELTREYLQIKKDDKPAGLVSVDINAPILHSMRESIRSSESTFETFIEDCINYYWLLLGPKLGTIQEKLRKETKATLVDACNAFTNEVQQILAPNQALGLLENINAAKTEIQLVLDRVSDWFELGDKRPGTGTFSIDQILDIAIEVIRRTRRGFTPLVSRRISAKAVISEFSLASLNDCIFIMLDNVYRHAHAGLSPAVELEVTYEKQRGILVVRCENPCGPGARTPETESVLKQVRDTIDRGTNYDEAVRREGRSGLFRLWRMTEKLGPQAIGFGFSAEERFWVEAHIPVFSPATDS